MALDSIGFVDSMRSLSKSARDLSLSFADLSRVLSSPEAREMANENPKWFDEIEVGSAVFVLWLGQESLPSVPTNWVYLGDYLQEHILSGDSVTKRRYCRSLGFVLSLSLAELVLVSNVMDSPRPSTFPLPPLFRRRERESKLVRNEDDERTLISGALHIPRASIHEVRVLKLGSGHEKS